MICLRIILNGKDDNHIIPARDPEIATKYGNRRRASLDRSRRGESMVLSEKMVKKLFRLYLLMWAKGKI